MDQPIAVFEPIRSGNYQTIIICLIVIVIALISLVLLNRKNITFKQKGYRPLLSLLSFFAIVIAAVTAFFSFWAAQKLTTVKVFPDAIETGFGKTELANIRQIYIHKDQQRSRLTGSPEGDITHILIIEEMDRKTHALSEENYQIDSLLKVLDALKK